MKPLIKKPSKFKEKVKSFFNFDIEKDLKEEDAKVFEKVNLFSLTREKLFIGIFLFLLVVNILVGFDINYFYLRAILGFLFLAIVPGLLIMLCFKIRTIGFWEYLVYTIGLSISFIMFGGLIVNWTLPFLGITDKPLSLYPILICFNIFLIALGIVAWKRNKDLVPFKVAFPKLDALNNLFFIIPMIFPVLAILGAFLLNNHGPNILTMIMLGGIAVYVLLVVIFRKKLNPNIYPWCLWLIGLSLLFMTSMRGWGIPSHDILFESKIFEVTSQNSFWGIQLFPNAYNACLSLNILPQIFSIIGDFSETFLFQCVLVLGVSLIPLISLNLFNNLFPKKILNFLSAFLIIVHTVFILELPMEIRQSFALIFFGLFLITLFISHLSAFLKKVLLLIFGMSIIVSHYSTAYIFMAIIILVYLGNLIYQKFKLNPAHDSKSSLLQKDQNFQIQGILILLLFIFLFFWYSQITSTSDGLISTLSQTFANLNNLFSNELKQQDTNLIRQINIFYKPEDLSKTLAVYQEESLSDSVSSSINYPLHLVYPSLLIPKINPVFSKFLFIFNNFITTFFRGLIIFGVLIIFFYRRVLKTNLQFLMMALVSISFLFLILILPIVSVNYSAARFFIQTLLILSPCSFFMINFLTSKKKLFSAIIIVLTFLLIFTFLFNSGFIIQVFGGGYPEYTLNNQGDMYDRLYFFSANDNSLSWTLLNIHGGVNCDGVIKKRLAIRGYSYSSILDDVLPMQLEKNSYLFSSYTNTLAGRAFKTFNNRLLFFNFPTDFLNSNKNKIYNNGGSEIYK